MPFFNIFCVSKVITTAHAHKSGVIFHIFPRAFKQKKIKALWPKMTKIASRGSCLKVFCKANQVMKISKLITYEVPKSSIYDWNFWNYSSSFIGVFLCCLCRKGSSFGWSMSRWEHTWLFQWFESNIFTRDFWGNSIVRIIQAQF